MDQGVGGIYRSWLGGSCMLWLLVTHAAVAWAVPCCLCCTPRVASRMCCAAQTSWSQGSLSQVTVSDATGSSPRYQQLHCLLSLAFIKKYSEKLSCKSPLWIVWFSIKLHISWNDQSGDIYFPGWDPLHTVGYGKFQPRCMWCCTNTECWDKRDIRFICYLYSSSYSVLLKQLLICFTQQPDDHWRAGHGNVSCHPHHAVSGLSVLDNFCNERFQATFPSFWIKCPQTLTTWPVKAVSLHLRRQHRGSPPAPRRHPLSKYPRQGVSLGTSVFQSLNLLGFASVRECLPRLVQRRV